MTFQSHLVRSIFVAAISMSFVTSASAGSLCRGTLPTHYATKVCYFSGVTKQNCVCDATSKVANKTGPNVPGWNSHELDKQFLANLRNKFNAAQGPEKTALGGKIQNFKRSMGHQ